MWHVCHVATQILGTWEFGMDRRQLFPNPPLPVIRPEWVRSRVKLLAWMVWALRRVRESQQETGGHRPFWKRVELRIGEGLPLSQFASERRFRYVNRGR